MQWESFISNSPVTGSVNTQKTTTCSQGYRTLKEIRNTLRGTVTAEWLTHGAKKVKQNHKSTYVTDLQELFLVTVTPDIKAMYAKGLLCLTIPIFKKIFAILVKILFNKNKGQLFYIKVNIYYSDIFRNNFRNNRNISRNNF